MRRSDERGQPFSWRFTTPIFMGSALNPINSSLIATALVPIARGVHVSVGQTAALVSSLYLASAIAQPTFGKLAEEFGPRRVFLTGITLVLAGGLLGGFGQSLAVLVIARVLIGIGTSAGYPSAMLMIRRRAESVGMHTPPGGVLGGLQIAGTAAVAVGLPLGGVLVNAFGWRSVFFANVPVTVVALVLAAAWLPRDPAPAGSLNARRIARRIDLTGIVAFGGALAALLVFLDGLPHRHWVALAVAAVLGIALLVWELRARPAFFDVRLLVSNLALSRTYLRFALTSLCIYSVLYGVSQWLEAVRGYSAQEAGLLILPMAALSAGLIRPISQRNLIRGPLIAAAVSSLAGAIGVLLIGISTPVIGIVAVTLIFGVTVGTFAPSNQTALYTQVDADHIGTAAGLLRTFGYIGSIGSAAILSVVFHEHVTDHGLHEIAAIMIGASIVTLLFTLVDRSLRERAGGDAPPSRPDSNGASREPERSSIVAGVDGSQSSLAALEWAAHQADLTGSALVVVAAWQFPSTYPPGEIYDDEDPAAEMRRVLDDSVSAVRHRHGAIEVSGLLIQGHPGPILVDASRGAELLIVGSRGHGEFAEVVLGSVGMHCVTHARCPVLVYRSVRDEVTTETSGAQSPAALQ